MVIFKSLIFLHLNSVTIDGKRVRFKKPIFMFPSEYGGVQNLELDIFAEDYNDFRKELIFAIKEYVFASNDDLDPSGIKLKNNILKYLSD